MHKKTVRYCQVAAATGAVALLATDIVSAVTPLAYLPADLHQLAIAVIVFLGAISVSIPLLRKAVAQQIEEGLAAHRQKIRAEMEELTRVSAETLSRVRNEGYRRGQEDGFRNGLLASVGKVPAQPASRRPHLRLTGSEDN